MFYCKKYNIKEVKVENCDFEYARLFFANNKFLKDKFCDPDYDEDGKLRQELKEHFYRIFPEYTADLEQLSDWDKLVNLTVVKM